MNYKYDATILITTKNRREDLRAAVDSATKQRGTIEVLVVDDGSTDGTAEMLRTEFPNVKCYRSEISEGYIAQRNRGAMMASSPVVFSIDDDAVFTSPDTVYQSLKLFDDKRIGALALPYIDVNRNGAIRQAPLPEHEAYLTSSYVGTAHALKRELFLRLGGYRTLFVHQGEEMDYCLRMLNAGYVVRIGNTEPIHHFESPKRDLTRQSFYSARNSVLHAWLNIPMPECIGHIIGVIFKIIVFGFKYGHPWMISRGSFYGLKDIVTFRKYREPVSHQAYRLNRMLKQGTVKTMQEVERYLPKNTGSNFKNADFKSVNEVRYEI